MSNVIIEGIDPKEKEIFDRSHDMYENKDQIWAVIDRSHDVDENKRVDRFLGVRPRYH